jgi:hypothetical protein
VYFCVHNLYTISLQRRNGEHILAPNEWRGAHSTLCPQQNPQNKKNKREGPDIYAQVYRLIINGREMVSSHLMSQWQPTSSHSGQKWRKRAKLQINGD